MAIYNCPKCNKRYYLDDNTIKSNEFQSEFRCEFCGAGYNDTPINDTPNVNHTHTENTAHTNVITNSPSTVGMAIKGLSIIVLVLCVIGSLVVIGETLAVGLAMLIMSVLFCLLAYGVGEIICLLKDIKNKL